MKRFSRIAARFAVPIAALSSACCGDSVDFVSLSMTSFGSNDEAYATIGDTVTLWSEAVSWQWATCVLYASQGEPWSTWPIEPERFEFTSSDPSVAAFAHHGHLTAHAAGQSVLVSTTQGVRSDGLLLTVSPPIASLALVAAPANVRVGDTIQLGINALDSAGLDVAGAHAVIELVYPTGELATWDWSSVPRPIARYYPPPYAPASSRCAGEHFSSPLSARISTAGRMYRAIRCGCRSKLIGELLEFRVQVAVMLESRV